MIAARTALDKAETALRRAQADPHKGAAPKGNPTDPASRVMPAKTGGYLQGYNLQALANPNQVILAIGTHDNSTDVGALHPLLGQARANLDAAGITDPIGRALFDAGYAATDNFTIDTEADLYVAVHNQTAQTGRGDAVDKTMPAGWQPMAARMATEEAKQLYRERPGIIEPVFASCSPASAVTSTTAVPWSTSSSPCGGRPTTCSSTSGTSSRRSAPRPAPPSCRCPLEPGGTGTPS